MRSDAILLAVTAPAQGDDKFRLGPDDWRTLRHALIDQSVEAAYSIELREWPDGLWSVNYGLTHSGPMAVDLGNMSVDEWYRRERLYWSRARA
jgi:hypothetical protein